MGGFFSCELEQLLNHVCSCFGSEVYYICNLGKNLDALDKAMKVLRARRADVLTEVKRKESEGLQRLNEVQEWLTSVEDIQNKVYELLLPRTDELDRLCLCGLCTTHLVKSHVYGKRVFEILEEVKELKSGGVFEVVAGRPTVAVVVERPLQSNIVGQEKMFEKAWNHLMDGGTKKMGLYGMGGVGKTTLLERINNNFGVANDYGFEIVIWVVVSSNLGIEKIQDEIGEKLGFITGDDSWKQKEKRQKTTDIHTRMKNKRFVLLLDDIWEEVDLREIGVPIPTRENGCRVAFTTRSRQVCGQMGVDDPMEVKCLEPDQAWDLFRDKVGRNTLESHPDILERASQVATKCCGLPLALIIIGKNMASKRTIQEWDDAIETLASSAAQFPGMEDHIFPILKYSYDGLGGDRVKSCFQYCALFPEDSLIEKDKLADYWICEGFVDEKQGIRKAINKAHGIIGSLVQACLLIEEGETKSEVKMHDVVREMALWIANDFGKGEERCIVQAGGLPEVPTVEKWTSVRRMSLMENDIENISDSPECPELTTLLFQRNKMETISGEFFKSMPKLVVLDLSYNTDFKGLPDEISELVSLRYLDLSFTGGIYRLPGGLLKLIKLIYLNLDGTSELESISGISKLSSLRTLRLADSNMWKDLDGMKELQRLEHLEVVTLDIWSSLVAYQLLNATATRVANVIQEINIKFFDGKDGLTFPNMAVLSTLQMYRCERVEINIESRTPTRNKSPTTSGFPNLSTVTLSFCDGLKDLTWLLYAPNLTDLNVKFSSEIEDIISKEKAVNIFTEEEAGTIIPFQRLEFFKVHDLPDLKSIYWSPLPFPRLREFSIKRCPNLRNIPLDSKSGGGEDLVIRNGEQHWIDKVEWEDEATKERFLSSLHPPK